MIADESWNVSGDAPRPSAVRRRKRILFAAGSGRPAVALQGAAAFAELLDAELHVLRVLPPPLPFRFWRRQASLMDESWALEQTIACFRDSRALCSEVLSNPVPERRLHVGIGSFVETVASHAAGMAASLVVLSGDERRLASLVTTLAHALSTPVLVARARAHTDTDAVVAATDLRDPRFPVLREASALASRMPGRVVAVHNLAPLLDAGVHAWPVPILPSEDTVANRRRRLMRATADLDVPAESVVAQDSSAVEAILAHARGCGAGVVIVGTRRRTWLDAILRRSIASQVIERARRSVLVIPLESRLH